MPIGTLVSAVLDGEGTTMAFAETPANLKVDREFIREAMNAALLSRDRELMLARHWRQHGDEVALHELVMAYMRLVISTASRFRNYGLPMADLVIGAVLVHGARAPYVIKRDQLALMKKNAVLVDVSIDQGGCFETSRPTTHTDPVYEVDGVTHYCVTNMPGAVPVTSTFALTNATLPYAVALADLGVREAIARDPGLRGGVNVAAGRVTHPAVAEGVGMQFTPVEEALGPPAPHPA